MILKNIFVLAFLFCASMAQNLFPLSIIHLNDMHAKFEETNLQANTCKDLNECIGGYARVVHMVKMLKETRPNVVYLNAADNFQGTLWYIMFRWNVTQHLLNLLPADAMTIGNHEFDDGINGLVPFLEAIKSPVVACNIDDSLEPTFQGKYTKSTVLSRDGRQIGIIGVTTTTRSGNWGKLNILPEVENVKAEVESLTLKGIEIIIVLSHCGLDTDREIAKNGGPIDLIVGGHSHSFLFTGPNPVGPDTPVSDYPTIVEQESGRKVLIVQASAYNKYLGNITLFFDDDGEIKEFDGAPIFLSHDIPQDKEVLKEMEPWKEEVDFYQTKTIGKIHYSLESDCLRKECSMGNLITDAMVYSFLNSAQSKEWTGAALGFINGNGIRSNIVKGDINYADVVAVLPFENTFNAIEINGTAIREILEYAVSNLDAMNMMQVSGIKVVFDLKRQPYDRIIDIKVICQECDIPHYGPIDDVKFYKVVLSHLIAEGGIGFTMIPKYIKSSVTGPRDADAVSEYIMKNSPISVPPLKGRITIV